jgi:SulP family sulfate permease
MMSSVTGQPIEDVETSFSPGRLFTGLTAGFVAGILTIIMVTAFGAMIFSGPLAAYVSTGISLILFGAFVIGLVTTATSSFPGTVARPHEIPAAILALMAAAIGSAMAGTYTAEETYLTVLAAITVTSLLTGAFFLILGLFKMGDLIRFIPYPVIGGFLAGTGLLLVKGAVSAMTDRALTLANTPYLLQFEVLVKWLPGLALALLIFLILRRYNHTLIMPTMLFAAIALFYAALFFTHTSLVDARTQGWLLKAFDDGARWQPLSPSSLSSVNWSFMVEQMGKTGTILIISCISLLLNASGLELTVRREIDLNRELKSVGIGNLLSGLGGGTVGIHSLSLSALGYKMGTSSRLVGLVSALLCGATLLFGTSVLSYFPRPVMGSLLLFLGFTFLYEWLYDAYFKLSRADYALVLLILAVIGTFGFLEGVGVGVFVAVILFVVKYSRISVVKHVLSGLSYRSNVDRPVQQARVLDEKGLQLYILKLQGYIFFGTASRLLEEVRQRARDAGLPSLRFAVLDFHLVNRLDSSAVNSFAKIKQFAETRGFALLFTNLSPALAQRFERGGYGLADDTVFHTFQDLDHGVEWCENRILLDEGAVPFGRQVTLPEHLKEVFPDLGACTRFMGHLTRQDVGPGYVLMRQGDPPRALYFIESGRVTVQLERENGETVRLRTMGAGTVVGELGMYLGLPATASVVTEEATTIYGLSVDALREMEEKDPAIATAFHKFVILLLGERLANTNRSLQALLD